MIPAPTTAPHRGHCKHAMNRMMEREGRHSPNTDYKCFSNAEVPQKLAAKEETPQCTLPLNSISAAAEKGAEVSLPGAQCPFPTGWSFFTPGSQMAEKAFCGPLLKKPHANKRTSTGDWKGLLLLSAFGGAEPGDCCLTLTVGQGGSLFEA